MNTERTDVKELRSTRSDARTRRPSPTSLFKPDRGPKRKGYGGGQECPRSGLSRRGWVFYDGDCRTCSMWAHRFERPLQRCGFGILPLQSDWARERLRLAAPELLKEMRVMLPDGKVEGGADAVVELSKSFWWGWPVWVFSRLPGAMGILRAGYRWIARRRCTAGSCKVTLRGEASSFKLQVSRKPKNSSFKEPAKHDKSAATTPCRP